MNFVNLCCRIYLLVQLIIDLRQCFGYVPDSSIQHRAIKPKFHSHKFGKKNNYIEKEETSQLLGFLLADFRSKHQSLLNSMSNRSLVFVLSDNTLQQIEGDFRHHNCDVFLQIVESASIDHMNKLVLSYESHELPDWVIFHVGAQDIVPEVPMTASIVASKLIRLQQTVASAWRIKNIRKSRIVLSGILPKLNGHPNFNKAAKKINDEIEMFARNSNVLFINFDSDFYHDGRLREEFFSENSLALTNRGAETVKKRLLDHLSCSRIHVKNRRTSTHEMGKQRKLVLEDVLPKNPMYYDKQIPPKSNGGPTVVYFHVTVLTIDTIDEESMTYVTDVFLAQSWRDFRLRLPENMTEEYRILDINWLKQIWCPDTFVKNAKQVTFHEMSVPNHYLWIHHNKNILYMAKMTLVLSCPMTFKNYPHDTQVCSMLIESLSHRTDDLVFRWNLTYPLVVNPEIELPQLDVIESATKDCTLEYSTGNFTCIAVVFTLRRRLGYHLFHTYIPTGLIVVMSWISFWISPEAVPARVTLAVTSLLTLATQNTQSQASLPPVSYVKAIDVWMSSCTVFVFSSLMEYAIVTYFMRYHKTNLSSDNISGTEDNGTARNKSESEGSLMRGMHRYIFGRNVTFTDYLVGKTSTLYKQHMRVSLAIDKFSRLFFPFSFILLNVIYWITFL